MGRTLYLCMLNRLIREWEQWQSGWGGLCCCQSLLRWAFVRDGVWVFLLRHIGWSTWMELFAVGCLCLVDGFAVGVDASQLGVRRRFLDFDWIHNRNGLTTYLGHQSPFALCL